MLVKNRLSGIISLLGELVENMVRGLDRPPGYAGKEHAQDGV